MDYHQKYLKYKAKYTALKNIQKGGEQCYTLSVKQPWFDFIKSGKKKIEGRLNSGLFAKLNIGDCITWTNNNLSCKTYITSIKKYDSFANMIVAEGIENVLPNKKLLSDGVVVYRQFYTPEREAQNGVVAIGLSVM